MLKYLTRIETLVVRSFTILSATFFTAAVGLYTLQVTLRLFFHSALYWIDPTIAYLFAITALGGAALACQHNENIKVKFFKRLSQKRAVQLGSESFACLVTLLILYMFYLHLRSVGTLGGAPENEWTLNAEALKDLPYLLIFSGSLLLYISRVLRIILNAPLGDDNHDTPQNTTV